MSGFRLTAGQLLALVEPGGPLPNSRVEYAEVGRPVCLGIDLTPRASETPGLPST
jgi:hypothetical protein